MNQDPTSGVTPANGTDPAAESSENTEVKTVSGAQVSSATKIENMEDLKKQAPDLYNQVMLSMGYQICSQLKRQQDHLKEIMQKARQESGG